MTGENDSSVTRGVDSASIQKTCQDSYRTDYPGVGRMKTEKQEKKLI